MAIQNNRIPMPMEDRADDDPAVTHVRIVNKNEFTIEDRYDSKVFEFRPGERVTIPYVVAQHIFGLGMPEKDQLYHCMRRFGWNLSGVLDKAKQYFNNISISPVFMRLVEVGADDDAMLPAPRGPGRPSKTRFKAADEDGDDRPA